MDDRDDAEKSTGRHDYDRSLPTLGPDGPLQLNRTDLLRFIRGRTELQGSLVVIAGTPADLGITILVDRAVVVGRENADLRLSDVRISRRHATVEQREGIYIIRDERSTNGTVLNGAPVEMEAPLRDGDKILVGETLIKFTLVDQTEAAYLRMMDQMVGQDDLTGLLAKHRFDAALEEAVRVSQHVKLPLSVLMMDMDRLKQLNDRFGHHVGAATIAEVGRIIGRMLRGRGRACRFGGDEFSAFLPGAELQAALLTAEQVRGAVEAAQLGPEGTDQRPTITIGVAERPLDITDARALLELADRALYRGKASGRNCVSR